MKKLVTISREYGSGGRIVGALVAEKLGVPMYDKELIDLASGKSGLSKEIIESAELRAKSRFSYSLSESLGEGYTVNEQLFVAQYNVIKEIGEGGEGVIVGRCADYVLREDPDVTKVFLYADIAKRAERCIGSYGEDELKIEKRIASLDKARRNYYAHHTGGKWGERSNYDLCINTSYISEETVANLIVEYINNRG